MEAHKQEILNTRVGGLGGSDAAMVLKIGQKGIESLSESDKIRLAVMTGQIPYKPIPTNEAMQRGNDFEKWLHENELKNFEWNDKLFLKNNTYSFKVFAHADFTHYDEYYFPNGVVIEAKCTSKNIDDTISDYIAQLQWYYSLGVSVVQICHCMQNEDFERKNFRVIEKDLNIISQIRKGLKLIDEFIKGWVYVPKEEWTDGDLLPFEKTEIELMYKSLSEIKLLEAEIEMYKANLLKMFEDNNVKSLRADEYSITYVGESITKTLDKAKLFKDHPEISEGDYQKTTVKKPYLKITLK